MFKKMFVYLSLSVLVCNNVYSKNDIIASHDVVIQLKSNGVVKGFQKFEKLLIENLNEGKKSLLIEMGRGQFFKQFPALLDQSSLRDSVLKIDPVSTDGKKENAYSLKLNLAFHVESAEHTCVTSTKIVSEKKKQKQKIEKSAKNVEVSLVSKDYVFPEQDELNLHSKSVQGAYNLVMDFIEDAHHTRKKVVLVITGKGNHGSRYSKTPEYKVGKIKQLFPEWLKDARIKDLVEDCAQAHGVHGGGGAFYVTLK
jgi:DNA-nicking Smr family endonuclease